MWCSGDPPRTWTLGGSCLEGCCRSPDQIRKGQYWSRWVKEGWDGPCRGTAASQTPQRSLICWCHQSFAPPRHRPCSPDQATHVALLLLTAVQCPPLAGDYHAQARLCPNRASRTRQSERWWAMSAASHQTHKSSRIANNKVKTSENIWLKTCVGSMKKYHATSIKVIKLCSFKWWL